MVGRLRGDPVDGEGDYALETDETPGRLTRRKQHQFPAPDEINRAIGSIERLEQNNEELIAMVRVILDLVLEGRESPAKHSKRP